MIIGLKDVVLNLEGNRLLCVILYSSFFHFYSYFSRGVKTIFHYLSTVMSVLSEEVESRP